MPTPARVFEVDRADLTRGQFTDEALSAGADGAVLAVRAFALTANNVTYAVFGEDMKYWDFFPASDGRGRVPVWGFAEVVETAVPDLAVGTRCYGYLPMASHLRIIPAKVTGRGFVDGAAYRAGLPAVYNFYERAAPAPADDEAIRALLQPLLITSYLIADFLADHAMFGAKQIVVSSGSSKTALGLGVCLAQLAPEVQRVGLTSAGHVAFTRDSGAWSEVVTYDRIGDLDAAVPTVFVDMAGSSEQITRVHGHFRDALKHSCRVGATHWTDKAGRLVVPGPKPVFFFAPSRIEKRTADWGPGGVHQRFGAMWPELAAAGRRWLTIEMRHGEAAVVAAWADAVAGKTLPSVGVMLRV